MAQMDVQEKLYTPEAFLAFVQQPENQEKRWELIGGEVCEMAPSNPTNTVTAGRILAFLFNYVEAHDLGYVSGADGGFVLSTGEVRLPDVAFIAKARVEALPDKLFPFAPDLAVEVISPTDTVREVREKVTRYLRSGTRLVWVVYPEDKSVDVHRLNEDGSMNVRTVGMDGALQGADVLPGFALDVKQIFP